MEEALQGLFLVDQEVNVVKQQDMDTSEFAAELVNLVISHSCNEFAGELLRSSVGCAQSIVYR